MAASPVLVWLFAIYLCPYFRNYMIMFNYKVIEMKGFSKLKDPSQQMLLLFVPAPLSLSPLISPSPLPLPFSLFIALI